MFEASQSEENTSPRRIEICIEYRIYLGFRAEHKNKKATAPQGAALGHGRSAS